MGLYDHIEAILVCPIDVVKGQCLGQSVEGRDILGYTFGTGEKRISLIAGNHADEPIGPLLLKKIVTYLASLNTANDLLTKYSWWIVPHGNPDGEAKNLKWYSYKDQFTDLPKYLLNVERELPGRDIEFGFPIEGSIVPLRPENKAVYDFWRSSKSSFDLHVSLHGMQATYGPWFLIDESWIDRTEDFRTQCAQRTKQLGYELYDLDRSGEKGFKRIDEGFCTRPDSKEMRQHFLALDDIETANKFHASSMESIRSLGGDCLTLVTEMPLFLYPKKKRRLKWPDSFLQQWSTQFTLWKSQLKSGDLSPQECKEEAERLGVKSMSWNDQMRLQWQMIVAGIETVSGKNR